MLTSSERAPEQEARVNAFRDGLRELGWAEGANIEIDVRWTVAERLRTGVDVLARSGLDVVLTLGSGPARALQTQGSAIPTVFVGAADPVGLGLVGSLARPGGSITGFTFFEPSLAGKLLQLLRELKAGIRHVGYMYHPEESVASTFPLIESAARTIGVRVEPTEVRAAADIDRAIGGLARLPEAGLIVPSGTLIQVHRDRIVAAAAEARLPTVYAYRSFVAAGGIASYGVDILGVYRRSATYVDRILKGESPANLPVQGPTKFDLVLNLKTAAALGVTIPPSLLASADEVIE